MIHRWELSDQGDAQLVDDVAGQLKGETSFGAAACATRS